MKRKIITVITALTGDRVVVGAIELAHAIDDHFSVFPQDIVLELLERVLKDPTEIYQDDSGTDKKYKYFYIILYLC